MTEQNLSMTLDVGIDVVIEIQQVRQDQPEWLRSEERRVGIFKCDRWDQHLPAILSVTPSNFSAPHFFQTPFRRWEMAAWAKQQLPQVLLSQA